MRYIKVSSNDLVEIKRLFLNEGQKIAAIKLTRTVGSVYVDGVKQDKILLREAKHAVEELRGDRAPGSPLPTATFSAIPRIKGVIIDTGHGDVELDLDGLQLRLLGEVNTLPISVIGPALELLQYFREWEHTHG